MSPATPIAPTAADLRAELARRQIRLYELAPHVRLNPVALGACLNGRRPLPPDLAMRLAELLATWGTINA